MLNHARPFKEAYKLKPPVYLPPLRPGIKKTLIFDIDETMIHCLEDQTQTPDVIIRIPLGETEDD